MNPTKHTLLTFASMVILCAATSGYAQRLQEMEVIDHGMAMVVVRNPDVGILIVTSVIPELSFESNMGIIKVEQTRPGEWILHLYPGTNLITFKSEGYKAVSDVRLVVPKKRARKVEVKPLITRGTLIVESDPPGASIFLDGEDTGKQTPYRFEGQETGTHQLVLRMIHYRSDTTTVDIKAGEIKTLSLPLQAMGYLILDSTPSGVEVVIDGGTADVLTVTTPVEKLALKVGAHSLSVHKEGSAMQDVVTIRKGEIARKHLDVQKIFRVITIRSQMNKWKRWKYVSLTTMILSGAASGASWVLADQNYKDYQGATSTEDADKFRKNVERFDQLKIGAAVATGVQLVSYFYTSRKQSYYKKQLQKDSSEVPEKGDKPLAQRSFPGIVPTFCFDGGVACVSLDIRF